MPEHHKVNIVRIKEILPHTNADTLGIVQIEGYQCVVKKENYKVGDLAIYVPPDTIVPSIPQFSFLWADREFIGEVPEKYRRITVRRFRKEWSEGLLMPLSDFGTVSALGYASVHGVIVAKGDDVAEILGFKHYEEPDASYVLGTPGRKLTLWQRVLKFFGYAPKPYGPKNGPGVYDVESIKHYPRLFEEGEEVVITEKIHGSNARYMFDGKTFWVGSHKRWCKEKGNIWWRVVEKHPWIEAFCREWKGFTLRGEVTPTQKGYPYATDHKDHTEERFFVFDLQRPDGSYVDKSILYNFNIPQLVPVVYQGPYSTKLSCFADGQSSVEDAKHIREGIVITSAEERTARGVGRAQLKLKSNTFLEKENKQ